MAWNLDTIFNLGPIFSLEYGNITKEDFINQDIKSMSFDCCTLERQMLGSIERTFVKEDGTIKREKIYNLYPEGALKQSPRCLNAFGQTVFNWENKNEF